LQPIASIHAMKKAAAKVRRLSLFAIFLPANHPEAIGQFPIRHVAASQFGLENSLSAGLESAECEAGSAGLFRL
jgi:hypothetical protein